MAATKNCRENLLEQCQVLLKEPTRFNIRRLVVLAQCIEGLDKCTFVEEEERRLVKKAANR